jgi:polyhydroxyalkanoate synthase subunit PhaE
MMDDAGPQKTSADSLLQDWLKLAADFWASNALMWSEGKASDGYGPHQSRLDTKPRAVESWQAAMKTWSSMAALMAEPGVAGHVSKGLHASPEILLRLVRPAWEGFFHMQQDWLERAGRIGKTTGAYKFENLDREAFRAWSEIYEKEFRQFLTVPQLGLTRAYQERMNESLDKLNVFQGAISEFLSMLYLPMEKASQVMQEKLGELAEKGQLPERSREYYTLWLKILEGHYMVLFKSPEYTECIARALATLSEFLAAKRRLLQDALQSLPIPTDRDMDDLYKEVYLLKKRVKELEKEVRSRKPPE